MGFELYSNYFYKTSLKILKSPRCIEGFFVFFAFYIKYKKAEIVFNVYNSSAHI